MQKFPMTAPGLQRLEEGLRHLKSRERPEVIRAIAEARSHGDLSENAEYQEARDLQAATEERIRRLEDLVKRAHIVTDGKKKDIVGFGSAVIIKKESGGEAHEYTIVGPSTMR